RSFDFSISFVHYCNHHFALSSPSFGHTKNKSKKGNQSLSTSWNCAVKKTLHCSHTVDWTDKSFPSAFEFQFKQVSHEHAIYRVFWNYGNKRKWQLDDGILSK